MTALRSLVAAAAIAAMSLLAQPASAENYTLDPVHSFAIFRIKHMGVSYSYGRFNNPEGTVEYDPAAPEKTAFNITLKVANLDTNNAQRDNHLKSAQFFNAKEIPTITFVSKSAKKVDDSNLEVTGDLTIHGVTKSITTKVEITGIGDMRGTKLVGFETTFTIKRTDFGMNELLQGAGDDVRIIFSIEAGKK